MRPFLRRIKRTNSAVHALSYCFHPNPADIFTKLPGLRNLFEIFAVTSSAPASF